MTLRFNRPFSAPIQAISFDLDDTLYYNEDVIERAEQAQFDAICEVLPQAKEAGIEPWIQLKWDLAKNDPEIRHDVTHWRKEVIRQGLNWFDLSGLDVEQVNQDIFDVFYDARSDFTVPEATFEVLRQLSKRFPLIAATNGNADIERVGLAPYFVAYYRAGQPGIRMKPFPDMITAAAAQLDIAPQHILHIGDNAHTDIGAALNAGSASLWFNPSKRQNPLSHLADGEYSDLADLLQLL